MFTGIVNVGDVTALSRRGDELRLSLRPAFVWEQAQLGESVAVCGVCLSVEQWHGDFFTAYASSETVQRTILGGLHVGDRVNMERALALGSRLGGHMVSGHVDTVATVEFVRRAGDSRCVRMAFDKQWSAHIISKGSVALDGVSLTVNACGPGYLEVNVIPETWKSSTVGDWQTGRRVNLETDMVGKYVQHLLMPYAGTLPQPESPAQSAGLSMDFLREHGF